MLKIKDHATTSCSDPLQQVTGIVERRHTLPILSNVLITRGRRQGRFPRDRPRGPDHRAPRSSTATREGTVTVGARKLYDILRSLPEDAEVTLEAKENRMTVKAGKSRFNLQTLPAADFPRMVEAEGRLARRSRCRRRR